MSRKNNIYTKTALLLFMVFALQLPIFAGGSEEKKAFEPANFILDHIADSYEWHVTSVGEKHISIPLPVIVYSSEKGFNVFLSSKFHNETHTHNGFSIASDGDYKGKIVETNANGEQVRPFDLSLTKNAASLLITSALLIFLILYLAKWYKKEPLKAPKGFRGALEMLAFSINDDVIKPSIGKDYKKYAPYLLTVFFFVFLSNILGLIPIFPGGANATGNIAITFVLAMCTFFIVNFSGTKEYWKEIFNPPVPMWLKLPIPIMPILEIFGIFTKPFALMMRLFANIFAGHAAVMAFMCLIFVAAALGTGFLVGMTFASVLFSIFMNFLEVLVAFIQAYVFTMLSAVFIGMAKVEPHHEH
jgi:F-type H+-transporting ATPase subunit a